MDSPVRIIVFSIGAFIICGYFWFRFGPLRCPHCRKFVFGYFGIPVGIRRMHFHCKGCGARFDGHKRLPL
jgi:hypothetical protein